MVRYLIGRIGQALAVLAATFTAAFLLGCERLFGHGKYL